MPEPGRPGRRDRCAERLREVNVARGHLRVARHELTRNGEQPALRAVLLAALEGYAAAITKRGAPVPHQVRNEIELYRGLRSRS